MSERTRKECSLQLEREFLSDTGFAVRGKPPQPPYSFLGNQSTKQAHLWHRPALCSSAKQEAHKKVPSATSVPQIGAVGGKLHYMKICPACQARHRQNQIPHANNQRFTCKKKKNTELGTNKHPFLHCWNLLRSRALFRRPHK
ncbi:uncharacterized protein LOC119769757 isoform X2 [Culex quinquefasciatus]|uniref:uncharacterized protein LOC119769757 isoform X2 n=1 Tax=Culex quinquefasciatus TaxID=7176 RepID=UPI0018E2D60B|nr:uncharacterized protein LOC119769757 isoform X2 [Culex quinquefasciatus]